MLADTFSGYSTFRSPEFKKALSQIGIELKYQDEFDQTKRAEALNQNQADLYVTTLDQFLKQKPQGKIVGLVDRTVGADAVVLNTKKFPSLKSVQDLEKLKPGQYSISYAADTPSEYLALVLDTKFEAFKLSNFESQSVADASDAWKQLQDPNQNLAVAVLWEPYVTMSRKQGYTVALSSQDAPTAIVDVIVASNRLIESQPKVVSDFLEAYYRRIDRYYREPNLLKEQIAKDGNLTNAEATTVLNGIDFFNSVEAKEVDERSHP
ncbi:MAG: ABC transporter substrate-binding protein, partial [Hydrococcus sp. RM1_1_31]|nr:ABC transporter substrate-binding protein [Hydrococcus sp. RM1_1_31]